jgi:flagella basal body P-ring formation protein FlgA
LRFLALEAGLLIGCTAGLQAAVADTILAPGQPLTPAAVANLIGTELVARGLGADATVDVAMPAMPIPNRATTPMRVVLGELVYDRGTGHYQARLRATLGSGETTAIESRGRVLDLIEVLLPTRPISRGETIGADDMRVARVPNASVRGDTLRHLEDVIGLQATRFLAADRPARAGDVETPWLVARGEPAAMVFARGGLEIVGAGVALDQGKQGQSIRVQNSASGEIRHATVVGPRRVMVDGPDMMP